MPNIQSISQVQYHPNHPYHFHYDNLPLKNIIIRQVMINSAVDTVSGVVNEAKGTRSDLDTRLNETLNPDGTFKSSAVPSHSIDLVEDSVSYVRMTPAERIKLDNISSDATALNIVFPNDPPDPNFVFDDHSVMFGNTSTVHWEVDTTDPMLPVVKAHISVPTAKVHHYNVSPNTSDYESFTIDYPPMIADSLRVYINGIRIFVGVDVKIPRPDMSEWDDIHISSVDTEGFVLSDSLENYFTPASEYVVRVDYNRD